MTAYDDEPGMLAAEYVLGSLDLAEMRDAEALLERDAGFGREVTFWQDHLAPLTSLVVPVTPPAALWSRLALATGIGGDPRRSRPGNPRLWQGTTAAALALAASFAAAAFLPGAPPTVVPGARFAAALAPLATPARFLAETQPDGSIVVVSLGNAPAPQGRDFQLWELPQGATAPVSLGVLPTGQRVIAPAQRPLAQTQLLVSEEPAGGSTTGAPTGPVVFGGTLTPLSPASAPGR